MATFKFDGKEIPAIDSGDWRADELAEAENALKINAGEARFAETMQLTFFVSRRRAEPSSPVHVVADQAKGMKLGWLNEDEEDAAGPLGDTDEEPTAVIEEQPTTGLPLSARSG